MSAALNLPVEIVDLRGLDQSFLGHLPHSAIVAAEFDFDPTGRRIAAATVRGGFAVLLTLAAFYGHAVQTNRIALGLVEHQLASVPEFPNYLKELSRSLETLQPVLPAIEFELPFASMSKADVIRRGLEVKVPFEDTIPGRASATASSIAAAAPCVKAGGNPLSMPAWRIRPPMRSRSRTTRLRERRRAVRAHARDP
jgi:7-cyano-7-deazaguanine synthase in queuosine biosynthesis